MGAWFGETLRSGRRDSGENNRSPSGLTGKPLPLVGRGWGGGEWDEGAD